MADQAPDGATPDQAPEPPAYTPPATQADLDRIIGERVQRERNKYGDYDDLRAKAEQFDQLQADNQSDLERAQNAAAEAAARADAAETALRSSLIRSAVITAASKHGAVDPDAVIAMLGSDAVTIDDAGQVTGAEAAVTALLDEKPYLRAEPAASTPPPLDLGQGTRGAPPALNSSALENSLRAAVGAI